MNCLKMNLLFAQFRKFKKMNIHNEKGKNENERSKSEYETKNEKHVKSAQKQEAILYIYVH